MAINPYKAVYAKPVANKKPDDKAARQRKLQEETQRIATVGMGERIRPPNWDVSRSVTGKAAPKPAAAAPKPKARPTAAAAAPKPKARPTTAAAAPKPKARPAAPAASTFKGNWKGAAPTEMQKRAGARIDRGGGLIGMLKRKMRK